MEHRWKTNFFRLKDGVDIGTSLFGADVRRDEEGRVQLYSISGTELCWLAGDHVSGDAWEFSSAGITVPEGMGSYDEEREWYEDLFGFELLDQILAEKQVVVAIEIEYYKDFIRANGYLWQQGGEDYIWMNLLNDIEARAVDQFGVSENDLHWNRD